MFYLVLHKLVKHVEHNEVNFKPVYILLLENGGTGIYVFM